MTNRIRMLLVTALMLSSLSPAVAMASYQDEIVERTARNQGVAGKWFSMKETDWVFYTSEAAAAHNMGAIKAGERVEVLKWNRFMARVRLPDGRVVFVRNRLLTESSAPTESEKSARAKVTSEIGRVGLSKADPYRKPISTDFAAVVRAAPVLKHEAAARPIPTIIEKPVDQLTVQTTTRPAFQSDTNIVATPISGVRVIPLTASAGNDVAVGNKIVNDDPFAALGVTTSTDRRPTLPSTVTPYFEPSIAAKTPIAAVKADEVAGVPVPEKRPSDPAAQTVDLYNGEKCDPTQKWQSPIREDYRIRDCIGSSRDGGRRRHAGIDIAGGKQGMQGIPIFASAPGRVIQAGYQGGYGCVIYIQHDSCPAETRGHYAKKGKCVTRYAHMASAKKNGKRICDGSLYGKRVTSCSQIGKMSGTGKHLSASDYAPHLHFEMRDQSESVRFDPIATITAITQDRNFKANGSVACANGGKVFTAGVPSRKDGKLMPLVSEADEGLN